MASKNQNLEKSTKAEMDASNPPGSNSNGDHSTADSLEEKEEEPPREEPDYATGWRLFIVMLTLNLAGLLTALEIGIIATAIPAITDQFHSINDVGWYGCATFFATATSAALWGKLYKYLNVKWVYMASIGIFMIGSIVAASAPNSQAVIVGRVFQGLGIGGTMSGSIIVINYVSHPKLHPMLIGTWWGVFVLSTILGPIIGGAFTTGVTWRWCFWINLPLGGPVVAMLLLFLRVPKHIKPAPATAKEILLQLDLPGYCVLLSSLVCFVLALQWGGQTKVWSDGSVIATLVMWIVLSIAFIVVEYFQGDRAMLPLRLLKPRTTWANVLYCFVSNSAFYQVMFYLPIYLQSIKGQSAVRSGVNTLPFLVFFGVGATVSGKLIEKTRFVQPYQLISTLLMTAGMALFYELKIGSSQAWYIGTEVLFGFGLGFGNSIPITAVQGFSAPPDIPSSTAIMFMAQSGSAVYFIVIGQAIFSNLLLKNIPSNISPAAVLGAGASDIHNAFSGAGLDAVLDAYIIGIKDVFACALAGAALSVLLSFVIPFKKLPDHGPKQSEHAPEDAAEKA